MTSFNSDFIRPISGRHLKILPKNFTTYTGENLPDVVHQIQDALSDIILAIDELRGFQFAARNVTEDGYPLNGSVCEALQGQFIRLTQTAASPTVVRVEHGLRRVPQGALWIVTPGTTPNQVLVNGEKSLDFVNVSLGGNVGNIHVFILF